MDLTEDQLGEILGNRNVLKGHNYRWINKTVPYVLSKNHTKRQNRRILKAMATIEQISCIKFVPRSDEADYVQFQVSFFPFLIF